LNFLNKGLRTSNGCLERGEKTKKKKEKKKRPKEVKKEKGWANFISDKLPRFLLDSFLGIFCTKNSVEIFL
jgi:hypothetical protein